MKRIEIIKGNITQIKVDAMVNAANSQLRGGSGVNGAIHLVGGETILQECKLIRKKITLCMPGNAVITTAGNLPAKYVIHTVGPVWEGGVRNEPELLSNAYKSSLKLAVENSVNTISFPAISTGVYGFPKKDAAKIAISTVANFLETNDNFTKIIFVCFEDEDVEIYNNQISKMK